MIVTTFLATFSSCFLLLLLLLLLLRWQAAMPKIEPLPAANPHGSEGRKSIKIAPKNCLMELLKPIEKDDFSYFFLLFPPAAAAPAPATLLKPIEKNDCSYFFLLFPAAAAAPAPATPVAGCDAKNRTTPSSKSPWQWRTEKHQNCAQKLPNVTSETHRKRDDFSYFFLLFPPAAAAPAPATLLKPIEKNDCSYFFLLFPAAAPAPATPVAGCDAKNRTTPSSKSPWQWRTEKHQNCTRKLPNVTSEWNP